MNTQAQYQQYQVGPDFFAVFNNELSIELMEEFLSQRKYNRWFLGEDKTGRPLLLLKYMGEKTSQNAQNRGIICVHDKAILKKAAMIVERNRSRDEYETSLPDYLGQTPTKKSATVANNDPQIIVKVSAKRKRGRPKGSKTKNKTERTTGFSKPTIRKKNWVIWGMPVGSGHFFPGKDSQSIASKLYQARKAGYVFACRSRKEAGVDGVYVWRLA